jgi:hypothetical protein
MNKAGEIFETAKKAFEKYIYSKLDAISHPYVLVLCIK